ncbi:RND family transporter [Methanohalophilus sp.]|uniref:efflux RND transporter permease subunit n=1 Tax=Methanohalophilus sp. TaxID=1966352 RepID=UPI0026338FE6|nr:RND family transporter [Methanohalophilus sp.]MDK2892019.1 uncharacterized protein [Methanohalophilus sp.]
MKNFFEKLGVFVEDNRFPVLIIAVLLVITAIQGAQSIEMKSGTETFVDKGSTLYQDYDHLYMDLFGKEAIVVMVEGDSVQDVELLKALDRLESTSQGIPGVVSTISPASVVKKRNLELNGRYAIPESKSELSSIADTVPSSLMPDDTHALLYVEMAGDSTDVQQQDILREVELSADLVQFPPGYEIIVTGDPAFKVAMNDEMMGSMGFLLLLSAFLMVVVLYLVFRHVRWRLMPLAIVLLGIVYTFGAMGFLEIPLTMVSMAAFPVLIGLGIDYAIQFHNRIEEELERGETPREAVVDTIKHMGPAVLIALTITALGFLSLLTSSVPMIQDFAKLLLIGIVMCFLASLFVGVTVLYILDSFGKKYEYQKKRIDTLRHRLKVRRFRSKQRLVGKEQKGPDALEKVLHSTSSFAVKHPFPVLLIAFLLCLNGLYVDPMVPINSDTETFVPQDMPALLDLKHYGDVIGSDDQINVIVKTDDVTDPAVLQWVDDFSSHEVESRDKIYASDSIVSVLKSMNNGELPNDEAEINNLLSRVPEDTQDAYIHGNNILLLNLNIGDAMGDLGLEGIESLTNVVREDINWRAAPPGMSVTITGHSVVFIEVLDALTSGRVFMTYLGLSLVFLGLLLIYRDWLKAFIPVATMFVVIGWNGGIMYYSGLEYTPMTATLGALILGVGSEYAVLMMERYFEEREKGFSPEEAMSEASVKIGKAVVTSGLTTLFGFCALIASPFSLISNFGLVTVIDVGLALFATFVIFPPVIVLLDNFRERRKLGTTGFFESLINSKLKKKAGVDAQ